MKFLKLKNKERGDIYNNNNIKAFYLFSKEPL